MKGMLYLYERYDDDHVIQKVCMLGWFAFVLVWLSPAYDEFWIHEIMKGFFPGGTFFWNRDAAAASTMR